MLKIQKLILINTENSKTIALPEKILTIIGAKNRLFRTPEWARTERSFRKSEKTEKDIINNAFSKGIKLSPLSQYYKNNEENKNIYVMNYSSLDSEKIELIVEKLKQCI